MAEQIFTLVCSGCKLVQQVKDSTESGAKSRAGKCQKCIQDKKNGFYWTVSK